MVELLKPIWIINYLYIITHKFCEHVLHLKIWYLLDIEEQ